MTIRFRCKGPSILLVTRNREGRNRTMNQKATAVLTIFVAVCCADNSNGSSLPTTFYKAVLPILQKNCQNCHRPGQIGPMPLLTFEQARPWAKDIKLQVASRKMPPWFADPKFGHFSNDRSLEQADIDTLVKWVNDGAQPGDPHDGPKPIDWPAEGWRIKPDIIVKGAERNIAYRRRESTRGFTLLSQRHSNRTLG